MKNKINTYHVAFYISLAFTIMVFVFAGLLIAPDYLANLRGKPETGWVSSIFLFMFTPVLGILTAIDVVLYNKSKK